MNGAAYRDHRGDPLTLGEELGAGGEGSVFTLPDRPGLCAKIYRPDKAAARADKIRAMLARPPPRRLRGDLAWPAAPIYTDAEPASFAGFVMPMRREVIELFRLLVPDERMAVAGWLTYRDLCAVAGRLARLVARVHRAGHCVGDLKPQNILVAPLSGSVSLIDTDSFQIRDEAGRTHRSIVVTPEYTAPELCGVDPGAADSTPMSDAFALAILIHQILLGGAHPFEGDLAPGHGAGMERIPGRIRRGLCALVPGTVAIRPAAGALPFAALHEGLRALFVRAFGPGHAAPAERPTADEWEATLARAVKAMVRCRASAAHHHDRALARCPWCERRARTGIDLFPAGQGWQRAVMRAGDRAAAPEEERIRRLRLHIRGRASAGSVTAAERAWLEKTGAALGFDRARVQRALEEHAAERAPAPAPRRWPSLPSVRAPALTPLRRRLLLSAVSFVAGSAGVAGVLMGSMPMAAAVDPEAPRRACEGAARTAEIGNTRGKGAFLRAAPSTASDKLPLPEGTAVRLTGEARSGDGLTWSEVEVPSLGRTGWVATQYLVEVR